MNVSLDALACEVRVHEQTLLFSDGQRRDEPCEALLQLVAFGRTTEPRYGFKAHGDLGSLTMLLALYCLQNPGVIEAVTGMMAAIRHRATEGG